ncbi:MAG: cytochrome c3 family protein [Nitrospirota bacterium]
MKSYVLRPLYVVIAFVCIILLARVFVVPKDFGIGERGFMYGWHRKGAEDFWRNFKVKYQTREYCEGCHAQKYETIMASPHAIIQCENCHGPAVDHPVKPEKLTIDRRRDLCLRCHAYLPYPTSGRRVIPPINNDEHYPDTECVQCHNPHSPGF